MHRTWRLKPASDASPTGPPDISKRGLCLLQIEFLVRYPASECIVTTPSLDHMDYVMDMFPKTLFHVFCAALQDPPMPNVIRHGAAFDKKMAADWRERGGAPFNIIFTGEGMLSQMALHITACPAAALHMITAPPEQYLEGELVYPLYCPTESCVSAMVPDQKGGGFRAQQCSQEDYFRALREFRGCWQHQEYSMAVEEAVFSEYSKFHCEGSATAALLTLVLKAGLPSATDMLRFNP